MRLLWFCCLDTLPTQVTKDATTKISLALDLQHVELLAKERQVWRDRALQFLRGKGAEAKDESDKPLASYRKKALQWLFTSENQLRVCSDKSWADFQLPEKEEDRPDYPLWPCLTVAADRGGDGECAMNFLRYKQRVALLRLPDDAHWKWDTALSALRRSGLYSFTTVITCCINCDHAPWSEARWWQTGKEAVDHYLATMNKSDCPPFRRSA